MICVIRVSKRTISLGLQIDSYEKSATVRISRRDKGLRQKFYEYFSRKRLV
jgi:hypothetical protein